MYAPTFRCAVLSIRWCHYVNLMLCYIVTVRREERSIAVTLSQLVAGFQALRVLAKSHFRKII